MPRLKHPGFSLLEVLVAVAVLAASAVLLAQIASFSRQNIEKLRHRTQAQLLCQSKLSEIVCGAQPLEAVSRQEFADLPGWYFSVEVTPLETEGLVAVIVTTWLEAGTAGTDPGMARPALAEFTLMRWIRDPNRAAVSRWNNLNWEAGSRSERAASPTSASRSENRTSGSQTGMSTTSGSPSGRRGMGFGGWRRSASRSRN